jgi:hypothetical protein
MNALYDYLYGGDEVEEGLGAQLRRQGLYKAKGPRKGSLASVWGGKPDRPKVQVSASARKAMAPAMKRMGAKKAAVQKAASATRGIAGKTYDRAKSTAGGLGRLGKKAGGGLRKLAGKRVSVGALGAGAALAGAGVLAARKLRARRAAAKKESFDDVASLHEAARRTVDLRVARLRNLSS